MADTQEKINIIDLEINQDEALQELTELHQQIVENKNATKDLAKANKELEDQGKANSVQYQNNAKQIETNKAQLKGLNKEYTTRQKIVTDVLTSNERELGTLEKLAIQNRELRQELRELNLETEEGVARQKEIVKQIDANTEVIKDNSDSYVQQKMNIGNYQSALDGLSPQLAGASRGIQGITAAAKAFIATPFGIILLAIAGAVKVIGEAFQRSQKLMDQFAAVAKGVGAALDVVFDRVSNALERVVQAFKDPKQAVIDFANAIKTNLVNRVQALPKLFTAVFESIKQTVKGNFDEAKASIREAGEALVQFNTGFDAAQQKKIADGIKGVRVEIREEAAAARELAQAQNALKDAEIEAIATVAQLTKEREKARLEAKDGTLSVEERLAAQDRAIAADEKILQTELELARERARISQEQIDLGKSTRDELEENARIQAELINLESAYYTRSKELVTERVSLQNQLAAEQKATADETAASLKKQAEDLQAFVEREVEIWKLRNQTVVENADVLTEELVANEKARLDELQAQQEAAVQQAFDNALITEQEKQLQLLQIQADSNAQKLALEQEFQDQKREIEESNAAQLFELQQAELETRLASQFELRRADLDAWYAEQQSLAKGNQEVLTQLDDTYSALRQQIQQEETNAKIDSFQVGLQAVQGALQENTVAYKAVTTALIAIDTYKAAISAFSAMAGIPYVGPILGGIAAAAATAAGLTAIRNVWAVDEKGGARSVSSPASGSGGGTSSVSASPPEVSISSDGGVVARDLDSAAGNQETIVEQQPVLVTDQVTADQKNLQEAETLATV